MTGAYVDIDLAALRFNLARVRELAPHCKVMSVIKADAYGHGVEAVAETLAESDAFAVARLAEAVALRQQGITTPITVFEGVNNLADLHTMAELCISPVFHRADQVKLACDAQLPQPLSFCWLMVETGMHRLGIAAETVPDLIKQLEASANCAGKVGLMSHFANSDLPSDPRNQQQLSVMQQLKAETQREMCFANSAAVVAIADSHYEWVRPGLMLYGASPFSDKNAIELGLKPVMQLKAEVMAIHQLATGDQVGYGGSYTAERPMTVAVVNIGYGDGYLRYLSNCGQVLINEQLAPVIGRVSMDSICIRIDQADAIKLGDTVTLWGHPKLLIEQVAEIANTIPYELMTGICQRVHKVYLNGES
jgi:alanine racemase